MSRSEQSRYWDLAAQFQALISPYCLRVEIAGSIRRGKPDPKDIEIVAAPVVETEEVRARLFEPAETRTVDLLALQLDRLVLAGTVQRGEKWGPRYKRVIYKGAPVDLFEVLPPAQWGVIFAIRTGPAEFSKALVTSRAYGGFRPLGYRVQDGVLWMARAAAETPEEDDFFRELGVPCWAPAERSIERLRGWQSDARATTLTREGGPGID